MNPFLGLLEPDQDAPEDSPPAARRRTASRRWPHQVKPCELPASVDVDVLSRVLTALKAL